MPVGINTWRIVPKSPGSAVTCFARFAFVCMLVSLGVAATAENLGEDATMALGSSERDDRFSEAISRFEKETGQVVKIVGLSSIELTAEPPLESTDFPQTIEDLAAFLGIEDYVATLSKAGAEIELIVLKARPQAAAPTVPEPPPARIDSQASSEDPDVPPLGQFDHQLVVSIYNETAARESWIDDIVLQNSRLGPHDDASTEEPYLTRAEEEAMARFFEELTSQAPNAGE